MPDSYFSLARQMAETQAALLAPAAPDPWAGLTLFRFDIDAEEVTCSEAGAQPYPMPLVMWAPSAREALKAAFRQRGGRGFSVLKIDPMPTHVRIDGEAEYIHDLGRVAFACALSLLAEQSGYTTHAEARAYLTELKAAPGEISKRLLAEYAPVVDTAAELAQALSTAGAPVLRAAE